MYVSMYLARAQLRELEAAKVSLDAQLAALEIQLLTKTQDAQRFEARAEELSALANGRALELAEAENALRASKGEVEKVRETIRVDELKFQTAYERVIAERDEARQALQRVKAELADMADLNMPLPDVVKKKRVLQTELSVATERVLQLEQTVYENKKAAYATQQASEVPYSFVAIFVASLPSHICYAYHPTCRYHLAQAFPGKQRVRQSL
jgi:hypothetical protein